MKILTLLILFFSIQLNGQMDTTSYSVGMIIAKNLKAQGLEDIDLNAFNQGVEDILEGNTPAITIMEANDRFKALLEEIKSTEGLANKKAGTKFLEENAKRPEVTVTASGLQYEVVENSNSGQNPTLNDKVKVHYHGTLIDGTVFDSSVERNEPISFPLNGVIAGWQEGLQLMPVGSKFKFYIPYDLAYGERAAGPTIKPYSTLVFEVELLGIE